VCASPGHFGCDRKTRTVNYCDLCNLFVLCPAHHRMVHHWLLSIEGNPTERGGLTFADDRGRLEPARPRRPVPGSPIAHVARDLGLPAPKWQHPPGEPLDTRWITWN
jgi:hypothetical protein